MVEINSLVPDFSLMGSDDKEHKLISCVIMNTDIVASLLYDDIEESDIDNIYQEGYCFDAKIKSLDIKDDDIVYSILLSTKSPLCATTLLI